ncbi:MAG TPA: alpha/beta fold hydrolase, partial [Thermoanaerobaculia bacterium]|nr:alpha/beta fold hydrolase [Thermoanaerobaculia bacterium]
HSSFFIRNSSFRLLMKLSFPPYSLWETRTGSGSPVVLLHGLSGSSRWWSRNIEALAAGHLVAAADLVGFGRNVRFTGLPQILPPFAEVSSLLARWIATFGEPVHVIGHSMGGQIAIRLAAEHPELVRSLILVNAAGIPFRFEPLAHVRPLPRPPYGGASIARVLVPDFLRAGPTSVAVATTRVVLSDMRTRMQALRLPVLLVWGANDPIVPVHYGEAMQREIEGARLVVIPRAAHVAMWDAPEEFNRIATEFLGEVDAMPPRAPAAPAFGWGISGWTEGMAHREAGTRRDMILVHGLGMSSRYFTHCARALFARGWHPVAPDLPGFGESANAKAGGPDEHARLLARWADALAIRDAVWVGHSIGCNAVARLAASRPDLVRRVVCVGPLWTGSAYPQLRVFTRLALDAFREPWSLYRFVIPAYWRAGLARWWLTWRRFARDVVSPPPANALFLAGARDPLPDRATTPLREVPGAHACVFSHADEVADAITAER